MECHYQSEFIVCLFSIYLSILEWNHRQDKLEIQSVKNLLKNGKVKCQK